MPCWLLPVLPQMAPKWYLLTLGVAASSALARALSTLSALRSTATPLSEANPLEPLWAPGFSLGLPGEAGLLGDTALGMEPPASVGLLLIATFNKAAPGQLQAVWCCDMLASSCSEAGGQACARCCHAQRTTVGLHLGCKGAAMLQYDMQPARQCWDCAEHLLQPLLHEGWQAKVVEGLLLPSNSAAPGWTPDVSAVSNLITDLLRATHLRADNVACAVKAGGSAAA